MQGTDFRFTSSFVKALSRTERYLLMLFYADQLTPAEIGQVLDLAERRVREMLEDLRARARVALKEHCTATH